ncbi:methionine adenosyltransferase 2 subunit beta-like [Scleropages formosus]|uniref:Methionine adenosyltransferase 2 subunit beta n=1 Tax=Scleropages formosus TaxID=113540 RepID=A0A0P7XE58_SCLFO|nr:methionine adenosyltransferase 2 subunit beta-like [Scleropages formosus]
MPGFAYTDIEETVDVPFRRVLVTGATGLLGRAVYREFQNNSWHILGCGYSRARPRFLRCNLMDEDAVREVIHNFQVIAERRTTTIVISPVAAVCFADGVQCRHCCPLRSYPQPHVIVHCAAERRPDVVERHTEAAMNLNIHASATLAKESATAGTFLIYISTDYVFDGRNPPYGENDAPNPLNLYGKSKLEGEREVLRHNPGAAVLRVPVLYGEVERVDESAVTVLWDRVQESCESSTVDHCQQRFPTYVNDVARLCRLMAERRLQDSSLRGIFHYSGKEQMTKYEMACAIADAFNLPSSHLIPLTEQPAGAGAQRPHNSQLECSRLESLGLGVEPTPFKVAVRDSLWPFLYDKRWRQTVFH